MPDIDTRLLRSFVSVATTGSISTAAEMLGCSQGTMSLRIRALETRLGIRLLDRSGRDLRLTPAGRDLYADARNIVEMHDRLFDRASPGLVAGSVRLGVAEGYGGRFLPRFLKQICGNHEAIELHIVCQVAWQLRQKIEARALDLAIVTLLDEAPEATVLSRTAMQWVASEDFVLDTAEPIPIACYPEGCYFRKSALDALESREVAYRVALSSHSEAVVQGAVAAGAAIAVMPESTIPAGLAVLVHPSICHRSAEPRSSSSNGWASARRRR